ncbi:MAG: peptidase MA family metallohydrolase [Candidatus Omnitrophota bacterium]|nr:peptidase MA family metallohydrolase [Candidatus Omnitrophota bacterium]
MKTFKLFFVLWVMVGGTRLGYAEEWKEYKKSHFIIYYQSAPFDFVENVEQSAERYYEDIARNLGFTRYKGWAWDERAKIYIYDSAEHYVQEAKQASWSHGSVSPSGKVIRTFPMAHGFFDSTLPHEIGHIVFREFVGLEAQVPLWFEEGVAMYQEQAKRWGAHAAVREAIQNGTFIPLEELTIMVLRGKTDEALVQLFYAESASIVNFMMNELGKQRFVNFCRELQESKSFDWTLDSIYARFDTIEDLNKAWIKYLEQP